MELERICASLGPNRFRPGRVNARRGRSWRRVRGRTEQKVRNTVLSSSHLAGDAMAPDAMDATEGTQQAAQDAPEAEELSVADRIRIDKAATRYLLEDNAGSDDDWSTF